MTPRPPILDELGRELVRAARAAEAHDRRGALAGAPRALVIGLLTLLGLAAVAAAASLIVGRGDPIPAARPGDVPLELRPVDGSARLNGLDVPDPDGGPAWDVRTSRSRTGAICTTVGQVLDGELGLLGLDRRFRALPAGAADTCSAPRRTGATLAGARGFRGGGRLSALTVVNGVAAPGVQRAVAIADGRPVAMRLGPGRAFLAVFRGLPEEVRPRVALTDASGHRTTLRFADRGEFIAGDPSGGSPWAVSYTKGAPGLRCVFARRQRGPDSPAPSPTGAVNFATSSVPPRCGAAGRPFVASGRFVPTSEAGGHGFSWGLNPARTVVWGAAPRGSGAVVLRVAGAPRTVRVDPRRRGFAVVLDGHVDPRELRVTVGGKTLREQAVGPRGGALARRPVPAWRSVATATRGARPRDAIRVDPGSVATTLRASDPTGGPAWALRSWTAKVASRVPAGGDARLVCFAIGVGRGAQLVEPRAGGASRIVGVAPPDGYCVAPSVLATTAQPGLDVRAYVDDPEAPDPQPVRVVVAGLLGDGARSAQLLGAGAPRPLELDRHGAFLVILGPEHAGRELWVRQVDDDGAARTAVGLVGVGISCEPRPGQSVRVADPDGGASWEIGLGTLASTRAGFARGGGPCRYIGRRAGERLAYVIDGETWLTYGAYGFTVGTRSALGGGTLMLELQGPGSAPERQPTTAPSPAQVARRTLPGRTVVSGIASARVTSITLRTPRDVRTVRPGAGGVFIAVYDGPFYGGTVRATAHLKGGRTVTKTLRVTLL